MLILNLSLKFLISATLLPGLPASVGATNKNGREFRVMRETQKSKTTPFARMRLAVAGFAGIGSLVTAGLVSFNGTAYSAVYGSNIESSQNVVAIVLLSTLFCVTAALSWAFITHLAESNTPHKTNSRKR